MLFVAGFQYLPIIYRTLNYVKMRPLQAHDDLLYQLTELCRLTIVFGEANYLNFSQFHVRVKSKEFLF